MTISTGKLRELASLLLHQASMPLPPEGDPTYNEATAKRVIEAMQSQLKCGVACIMALSDEVDRLRGEVNAEPEADTVPAGTSTIH